MSADAERAVPFRDGMPGYVQRDWEIVDYRCHRLAGTDLWFRGPPPPTLEPGGYFTAIGAAQTFGCFCERPYPALLADRLGMPGLNLGYSGAGPGFFLRRPALLDRVNAGAFCVVQVMSARSTANSGFENVEGLGHGRRVEDGRPMAAEAVFADAIERSLAWVPLPPRLARGLVRATRLPLPPVRRLVRESRANWLEEFRTLLEAITVPKILFWFSERRAAYTPRYHRHNPLLGKFPHLVDDKMIAALRPRADAYVECVSRRGLPQPLVSRFTGRPTTVDLRHDEKPVTGADGATAALYSGVWRNNMYYPSPEMHEDGASLLLPASRAM